MTGQPLHGSNAAARSASASDSAADCAAAALSDQRRLACLTANGALLAQAACDSDLRGALLACAEDDASRPLRQSLLSDRAILRHLLRGSVVIAPFCLASLSTSSYDVTLGPHYFREAAPEPGCALYNPYCADHVARVWGEARLAERHSVYTARTGQPPLRGIAADDLLIWVAPGETILAHTVEYIGGTGSVTTMMKARSSMGRNFIEVCKCAGWGDVGYTNRWTMEVTNNSRYYSIPLVVGRRIAQIVFFSCDTVLASTYEQSGKYQATASQEELMRIWRPEAMLPKMYKDRECLASQVPATTVDSSGTSDMLPKMCSDRECVASQHRCAAIAPVAHIDTDTDTADHSSRGGQMQARQEEAKEQHAALLSR